MILFSFVSRQASDNLKCLRIKEKEEKIEEGERMRMKGSRESWSSKKMVRNMPRFENTFLKMFYLK